jgi:hypothetical protein
MASKEIDAPRIIIAVIMSDISVPMASMAITAGS